MMKFPRLSMMLAAAAVLLWHSFAAACPTCKDALAADGNASNLVNGFGWSIIFMMAMPFLVLAGIGGYFYYEICKARRVSPEGQAALPSVTQATAT